jgi:hypothetical protein
MKDRMHIPKEVREERERKAKSKAANWQRKHREYEGRVKKAQDLELEKIKECTKEKTEEEKEAKIAEKKAEHKIKRAEIKEIFAKKQEE